MPNLKTLFNKLLNQLGQIKNQPPLFAGKAIGLAIGYAAQGWLGGVLGAFIGHSFDIKRRGIFSYLKDFWQAKGKKKQQAEAQARQEKIRQEKARRAQANQQRQQRQQQSSSYTYSQSSNPEVRALARALVTLGLSGNATGKEIKTAYRKLMSQHHPDKLVAKNSTPAQIEAAKEKTQAIQEAYARLKKGGRCD